MSSGKNHWGKLSETTGLRQSTENWIILIWDLPFYVLVGAVLTKAFVVLFELELANLNLPI